MGRFTHTGEAFGLGGQTIARIAYRWRSLLVLTGPTLALRRLAALKSAASAARVRERRTIDSGPSNSVS